MVEGPTQEVPQFSIDQSKGPGLGGFGLFTVASLLVIVILTVFFYVYYLSLNRKTSSLQAEKADLVSQIMTPDNQKLEGLVNGAAASIQQINQYKNINGYSVKDFLEDFPKIATKQVTVRNLSLDSDGQLRLDAVVTSQIALAQFLTSMKNSGIITNISLSNDSITVVDSNTTVAFSITAGVDYIAAAAAKAAKATASNPTTSTSSSSETTSTTDTNSTSTEVVAPTPVEVGN